MAENSSSSSSSSSSSPMVEKQQYYSSSTDHPVKKVESKLNPFAKEWNPWTERGSEEERSLFFTFSFGHPLRKSQIRKFFTEKYGICVEKISLRSKQGKGAPKFGQIVFKSSALPLLILNGTEEVRFMVNQRSLWCKKYQDRKMTHDDYDDHPNAGIN